VGNQRAKQLNDYTSGPQWGIGIFGILLGLAFGAAVVGRAASVGDVGFAVGITLVSIGLFFGLLGVYALFPGHVRRRMEPWASVVPGALFAVFLVAGGILCIAQADLVTGSDSPVFRAPRTPSGARVAGVLLIVMGVLPTIGVVTTLVRYFRRRGRGD
jgi:hypothetical protein